MISANTKLARLILLTAVMVSAPLLVTTDASALSCGGYQVCLQVANAPTITSPVFYLVKWNWGSFENAGQEEADIDSVLYGLPGTKWENILVQYNNPNLGTTFNNTAPQFSPSNVWNDTAAGTDFSVAGQVNETNRAASHFGISSSNASNAVVVLAFPHSPLPNGSPNYPVWERGSACGSHGNTFGQTPIAFIQLFYEPDEYSSCYDQSYGPTTGPLEHEIAEVISDPQPTIATGWAQQPAGGSGEIGDICQTGSTTPGSTLNSLPVDVTLNSPGSGAVNQIAVVPLWSRFANQQQGACAYAYQTRTDLFYTGSDANVYWRAGAYASATLLGKPNGVNVVGPSTAASWGPGRIDVNAVQSDGALGHGPDPNS